MIRRHALVLDNCTVDAQKCFCSVYDLIFDWFAACRLMSISQHCETGACHYSHSVWLGSRVVSVLDSGAEGLGFKSQS